MQKILLFLLFRDTCSFKNDFKEKNSITKNVNYFLGYGIIRSIYPRQTQISVTFAIILYDFSLFYRNLGHHW